MTADLASISEANDLAEVAREYGMRLTKQPNGWLTRCIWHADKTASLRLHTAGKRKGRMKCFSCGKSADVFDLVRQLQSCDLPTAKRILADRAGITISDKPPTRKELEQRRRDRFELAVCEWWYDRLVEQFETRMYRALEAWDRGNEFGRDVAEVYSSRLGWIIKNRDKSAGMARFRLQDRSEIDALHLRWKRRQSRFQSRAIRFLVWLLPAMNRVSQSHEGSER